MAVAATSFVGRDAELDRARVCLKDAREGRGHVLIVDGEAGIGKSRFLQEVLREAGTDGFVTVEAACDEALRTRPFAAIAQAIAVAATSGPHGREVVGDPSSAGEQFRVIEAIGAAVESLATQPLVIALDDLHWADPGTLLAFRDIAGRAALLPMVLIGSVRRGHEGPAVHRLREHLERIADVIELGPLDRPAIASMATELLGASPDETMLAQLDGAHGNPLFVAELTRAVAVTGTITVGGAGAELPVAFRVAVRRRIAQLPQATQDALRLASVLGSRFSPRDLATLMRSSVIQLEPTLHAALASGVIDARDDALAFRHDLVRVAVYEHIPLAVRRELHREVGAALAAAGADAATVARHLVLGATSADAEVASWLRRAAAEASGRSPALAVELLEQCRDLLPADAGDRAAVLTELVLAYASAGRLSEAEALGREVLDRWPGRDALVLGASLVRAMTWQGRPGEALALFEIADDDPLDDPAARSLAAEISVAALQTFDIPRAAALSSRVIEAADGATDELTLCEALSVRAWTLLFMGEPHGALDVARRSLAVADDSGTGRAHLAHPCFFIGMPLIFLDRLDEAARLLQEGRRLADERGLVWSLPLFHSHLGVAKFASGEWDEAVAEIEAGLAIADEIGLSSPVVTSASAWLAAIHVHRDELEAADVVVGEAIARQPERGADRGPLLDWARALICEARGDLEGAVVLLQGAWDVFMRGGNVSNPWSAMALVRICVKAGQRDRASALLPMVDRQATVAGTPFLRGQALRCHGLVSGDVDDLLASVAEYRRCPRPHELAGGCEDAAGRLASVGRVDEARPLFEEALGLYERVGALRDANRTRASMRTHGLTRGARHSRTSAVSGWESLTPAERRVVELAGQRFSNPEIAERLFLSRHTVESHLKHVYRKLGLSSRIELAAEVARRR